MRSDRKATGLEGSAPIFAALGDATRLKLVVRLGQAGPQSIARLTRGTPFTRQAITKHLHILADAGFVRGVRLGRESRWELNLHQFQVAHRYLNLISRRWDTALGRLKDLVEE